MKISVQKTFDINGQSPFALHRQIGLNGCADANFPPNSGSPPQIHKALTVISSPQTMA
jgi:hypothetical protein